MITVEGNKFSRRLFGTNLSASAVYMPHESADWYADFLSGIGMNAVRFAIFDGYPIDSEEKWDNFHYLLYALKEAGLYWNIPLTMDHTAGDFTDQSRIDWKMRRADDIFGKMNPYTGMTVGEDPNLAMIEISNEASVWRDSQPDNWDTLDTATKHDVTVGLIAIETDYYGKFTDKLRTLSNALINGSNNQYCFQPNTGQWGDIHMYVNRSTPSNPPCTFDNRKIIDDGSIWPVSDNWNRIPEKPFGCTEYNDACSSYYYHTNLLTMIAAACVQDWSFMFHHHMGNRGTPAPDKISGTLRDDGHTGKIEILKIGADLFLNNRIAPSGDVCGYVPDNYVDMVVEYGDNRTVSEAKKQPGFSWLAPLSGSPDVDASIGNTIKIKGKSGSIESYDVCTYSRTIGKCYNHNIDMPNDNTLRSYGNGPVVLDVL